MKNTGEKLAILLLCLALLIGMIPVVSQPVAAAAGITEVSDMETFKALMSQDGDVSIKLTAHLFEQHGYAKSEIPGGDLPLWAKIGFPWMMAIDHELPCYYGPNGQYVSGPSGKNKDDYEYKMPYWLILGSGSKRQHHQPRQKWDSDRKRPGHHRRSLKVKEVDEPSQLEHVLDIVVHVAQRHLATAGPGPLQNAKQYAQTAGGDILQSLALYDDITPVALIQRLQCLFRL